MCKDLKLRLKRLSKNKRPEFVQELISLLAWAQHRFLWIHPFQDYNGRIARLLTNVILINLNLPPIELKVETKSGRDKYIKSLQEADKGNFRELQELIKQALKESVKSVK